MSARRDPLASLVVFDRLEVGPVRLQPEALACPYTVVRGGAATSTELTYRYNEPVFDPHDPAAIGLASMIAAQVALNYGLFCREIVFRGPFDAADRAFLAEMAENTAREIFVKKFLEENPFLVGPARELPVVRRERYLAAELRFPDAAPATGDAWWAVETGRAAVLSSGGKDSLLSFGLLDEIGWEAHSLFVNESGRHWYTALNAFRHLSGERPETTARIWTTADRLFSWMLRQMPFVRDDFAQVRSDEYPIRLWTVAVFLFGVLPVARRRKLGLVVIGDEFDTSRKARSRGISHYDGLYDQSRWFDEALTRYYRRKGWPVTQVSLLRPLSELLIQKTLVERYPELQRHQTSCHATHIEGDRVRPCGRCEKCRRIVGMLTALGADATACGYRREQIADCLRALARHGVHQESAGAEHLAWMLAQAGHLSQGAAVAARPHPEVLKLRFHREAAPLHGIPRVLRRPLYTLLLEHADGAVQRSGRAWVPFDALGDPSLSRPYRHEIESQPRSARTKPAAGKRGKRSAGSRTHPGAQPWRTEARLWRLGEQNWVQAGQRLAETDTALLPVGAIEQHGPHLPLDTDAWDAERLCDQVAERCSDPRPLVLPLVPYGVSYHHDDFPGTLSVSPEALWRLVYDVGVSAARHGISKLIIVNGHGGNAPTLQLAAQMINRDAHIFTCVDTGETSDPDVDRLAETPNDVHAGEIETSTALATRPGLVDTSAFEAAVPRFSSRYLDFSSKHGVEWYAHTARLSPSGVLGDPTRASREKGEAIWGLIVDRLVEFVERLKGMSLAEIHARRH